MSNPGPAPLGSTRAFLVTMALVAAAIAGLFVADSFLAGVDRRAARSEAAARYQEGIALLHAGQPAAAMGRFRDALALQRNDRGYQLALAAAALAAHQPAEAIDAARATLEHDATDGAANLEIARALRQQHRLTDGIAYYHRAVYGHWADSAAQHRAQARLELIDVLAQGGQREDLLAELLLLQNSAPADTAVRRRLGHLFIAAGSAARATDIFRELLARDPNDADARGGLGTAEFAQGNYRSAEAELLRAVRIAPGDTGLRSALERVSEVRALDPLERGLSRAERTRRSRNVLAMVLQAVDSCPGVASAVPVRAEADSARAELLQTDALAAAGDGSRLLDRADVLWAALKGTCHRDDGAPETPLELVLHKMSD